MSFKFKCIEFVLVLEHFLYILILFIFSKKNLKIEQIYFTFIDESCFRTMLDLVDWSTDLTGNEPRYCKKEKEKKLDKIIFSVKTIDNIDNFFRQNIQAAHNTSNSI